MADNQITAQKLKLGLAKGKTEKHTADEES